MVCPKDFYDELNKNGFNFFAGVPDSLLKELCSCISHFACKNNNIITANEGNAVALACGYNISTGKTGVVYMQNSGIGNAVNPLLSLADEMVYEIPFLMIIGYRGEPGVKDEPQHKKQGILTLPLLETMGVKYIVADDDYAGQIAECRRYIDKNKKPVAIIIKNGYFKKFSKGKVSKKKSDFTREEALNTIISNIDENEFIVSTTGKTSREIYEIREKNNQSHGNDFLTVGSMGHTASLALGISLGTAKNIYCIDGDGSMIMHMGGLPIAINNAKDNFKYIVINNGCHQSVGGQPTISDRIDYEKILEGFGFSKVIHVYNMKEMKSAIKCIKGYGKTAVVVYTNDISRDDLTRPKEKPVENKEEFINKLRKSKIRTALILNSGQGKRLLKLTENKPKCLLELYNGETILDRQIRILAQSGIEKIIITVGPFAHLVKQTTEKYNNIEFIFVDNPDYDHTNYIVSIHNAGKYIDEDILLLHGDLVFDESVIEDVLKAKEQSLCLYNKSKELPLKDFKGRFHNDLLKEVSVDIFDKNCYAFWPVYKLPKEVMDLWLQKIDEYVDKGIVNVYAENALNEITDKICIYGYSCENRYIEEIDNEEDYIKVSDEIKKIDGR